VEALLVVGITQHGDNIALCEFTTDTTPTDKQTMIVIGTVVGAILRVEAIHRQRLLTFCSSTINVISMQVTLVIV